jgi:hypothetical protein
MSRLRSKVWRVINRGVKYIVDKKQWFCMGIIYRNINKSIKMNTIYMIKVLNSY